MNQITHLNFVFYNKHDWDRLMTIIADRDKMLPTWEAWHRDCTLQMKRFKAQGFHVRKVIINLDELVEYCKERNIPIDGTARSQFVQAK